MILSYEDIAVRAEFHDKEEPEFLEELVGLESMIRAYTNNNFQNRAIRFSAASSGGRIMGTHPYLRCGDTVQITKSGVNDGLYVVESIKDGCLNLYKPIYNETIFDTDNNLITKVEYPADIRQGALSLMTWKAKNGGRIGVKSETLSRHSVTYYDLDMNNQVMGYPIALLGFLEPYKKARV